MSQVLTLSCPHCLVTNRVAQSRLGEQPVCGKCRQPLFSGAPVELDSAGFERLVANTELPVVVDFWASWCGPCKMMAPVFAQAAQRLEPAYRLVKVNTETEPMLAQRYQIRSIPTLLMLRGGQEVARQAGALDLASLERWVRSH